MTDTNKLAEAAHEIKSMIHESDAFEVKRKALEKRLSAKSRKFRDEARERFTALVQAMEPDAADWFANKCYWHHEWFNELMIRKAIPKWKPSPQYVPGECSRCGKANLGHKVKRGHGVVWPVCECTKAINRLRSMPYSEYLRTDHWKTTREGALQRAGRKCQLCGEVRRLQVHHNTYENRGCEKPADLIVLCASCHDQFHKKSKLTQRSPNEDVDLFA